MNIEERDKWIDYQMKMGAASDTVTMMRTGKIAFIVTKKAAKSIEGLQKLKVGDQVEYHGGLISIVKKLYRPKFYAST